MSCISQVKLYLLSILLTLNTKCNTVKDVLNKIIPQICSASEIPSESRRVYLTFSKKTASNSG